MVEGELELGEDVAKRLYLNEYVLLMTPEGKTMPGRYYGQNTVRRLQIPDFVKAPGGIPIRPRNLEQQFFVDALMDDSISLVTCFGKAGTGKTLLSTACALFQTTDERSRYDGLSISRPVIALGKDEYRLVLFKGGLPGAGWDGTPKIEVEGKRDGEGILFKDNIDSATVVDGTLTIKSNGLVLKRTIRHSPSEGLAAPKGAIILFDGKNADAWENGKIDPRGFLEANTKTKQTFTDFTLHLEFFLPFKPLGRGQGRANSGLYLQHRYEVQVLDSFGLKGLDNECGGIYTIAKPQVNMCLPPLTWQTYDIDFTAAKFDDKGVKTADAQVTVKHNGVLIHDAVKVPHTTTSAPIGTEGPRGPFHLQNHGCPVRFRNFWVLPK